MQTEELIDQTARWWDLPDGIVLARLAQDVGTGYKPGKPEQGGSINVSLVFTEMDLMGKIKLARGRGRCINRLDGLLREQAVCQMAKSSCHIRGACVQGS